MERPNPCDCGLELFAHLLCGGKVKFQRDVEQLVKYWNCFALHSCFDIKYLYGKTLSAMLSSNWNSLSLETRKRLFGKLGEIRTFHINEEGLLDVLLYLMPDPNCEETTQCLTVSNSGAARLINGIKMLDSSNLHYIRIILQNKADVKDCGTIFGELLLYLHNTDNGELLEMFNLREETIKHLKFMLDDAPSDASMIVMLLKKLLPNMVESEIGCLATMLSLTLKKLKQSKPWCLETALIDITPKMSTIHFKTFVQCLFEFADAGSEEERLIIWKKCFTYLLRLLTQLNHLRQHYKDRQAIQSLLQVEQNMCDYILKFRCLYCVQMSRFTRRELALCAFSISPTEAMYKLIASEARDFYNNNDDAHVSDDVAEIAWRLSFVPTPEFYAENEHLEECEVEDLLSVLSDSRDFSLSWRDSWSSLAAKCKEAMRNAPLRNNEIPLENLEPDWSCHYTWVPDAEFYEPGFYPPYVLAELAQQERARLKRRKRKNKKKRSAKSRKTLDSADVPLESGDIRNKDDNLPEAKSRPPTLSKELDDLTELDSLSAKCSVIAFPCHLHGLGNDNPNSSPSQSNDELMEASAEHFEANEVCAPLDLSKQEAHVNDGSATDAVMGLLVSESDRSAAKKILVIDLETNTALEPTAGDKPSSSSNEITIINLEDDDEENLASHDIVPIETDAEDFSSVIEEIMPETGSGADHEDSSSDIEEIMQETGSAADHEDSSSDIEEIMQETGSAADHEDSSSDIEEIMPETGSGADHEDGSSDIEAVVSEAGPVIVHEDGSSGIEEIVSETGPSVVHKYGSSGIEGKVSETGTGDADQEGGSDVEDELLPLITLNGEDLPSSIIDNNDLIEDEDCLSAIADYLIATSTPEEVCAFPNTDFSLLCSLPLSKVGTPSTSIPMPNPTTPKQSISRVASTYFAAYGCPGSNSDSTQISADFSRPPSSSSEQEKKKSDKNQIKLRNGEISEKDSSDADSESTLGKKRKRKIKSRQTCRTAQKSRSSSETDSEDENKEEQPPVKFHKSSESQNQTNQNSDKVSEKGKHMGEKKKDFHKQFLSV